MRFPRILTVLACLPTALLPFSRAAAAEDNPRITQIERQIAATKSLIGRATSDVERVQWEQRLALSQQDLESVKLRLALEEKEKKLTAEHRRHTDAALRDALQAIDVNVAAPEAEARRLNGIIRQLRVDRSSTEEVRQHLQDDLEQNAERIADIEQRLRNEDEEILARQRERDAAELKVRLGNEGTRIDQVFRGMPLNPRPTIRLMLEKRHYLDGEEKQAADAAVLLEALEVQRKEVSDALGLAQDKLSHCDAELDLLKKKMQVESGRTDARQLYYVTSTEKKLLAKRIESQQNQLAAIDQSRVLAAQLRDLYDREVAYLGEDLDTLVTRYRHQLVLPSFSVAALVALYLVLSLFILPIFYHRDNLFIARRLCRYLLVLSVLFVMAMFFLEDLKQIGMVMGIASAAVVIALQDLFSSLAGWFVIVGSRKIKMGDRVEIEGHRGDIIDIQILRTTMLEVNNWLGVDEATGRVVLIPNNFVFKYKVFNYTHVHPYIWNKIDITVTFETPPGEAGPLLARILEEETREEFAEAAVAGASMEERYGVSDTVYKPKTYSFIADSGIMFRLLYVCHYRKVSKVRNRINKRIIAEFAKDPRLQFAYPTQRLIPTAEPGTLHVATDGRK